MSTSTTTTKRIRHSGTAYREMESLKSAIHDRFSAARSFHSTHDELCASLRALDPRISRLQIYAQEYLRGVRDTLLEQLWREMEWRIEWRGREYSSDKRTTAPSTDLIETGTWSETKPSRFVWAGTDRTFTVATE